jgi:hypothetical protein
MARSRQLPSYTTAAGAAKRLAVYEAAGYACAECRLTYVRPDGYTGHTALSTSIMVNGKSKIRILTIDHIVPRRYGGSNELANLQALCTGCNSRKGAKVGA